MASIALPQGTDEKIDVRQIRITQSQQQTAVLGELRAADRLLWSWADRAQDAVRCDFEVTFQDGYVYRGRYEFSHRSRSRPSLSKFLRATFDRLQHKTHDSCMGAGLTAPWPGDLARYAIDSF